MICKSNKSSLTMSIILCAVGLVGIYLLVVAYNKYKFTKFVKKLPTDKAVEMADDGLWLIDWKNTINFSIFYIIII